jgi:hypothetical protein
MMNMILIKKYRSFLGLAESLQQARLKSQMSPRELSSPQTGFDIFKRVNDSIRTLYSIAITHQLSPLYMEWTE